MEIAAVEEFFRLFARMVGADAIADHLRPLLFFADASPGWSLRCGSRIAFTKGDWMFYVIGIVACWLDLAAKSLDLPERFTPVGASESLSGRLPIQTIGPSIMTDVRTANISAALPITSCMRPRRRLIPAPGANVDENHFWLFVL